MKLSVTIFISILLSLFAKICNANDGLKNEFIIQVKISEMVMKRVIGDSVKINNTILPMITGEFRIPFQEKNDFDSLYILGKDSKELSQLTFCRFKMGEKYILSYNVCGDYYTLEAVKKPKTSKAEPTVRYRVENFLGSDTITGFDRFTHNDVRLFNGKLSRKVVLENKSFSEMCTGGEVTIGIENKSKKEFIEKFKYYRYEKVISISFFPLHPENENLLFEYDFSTSKYTLRFNNQPKNE